jgi:hypothetical protein
MSEIEIWDVLTKDFACGDVLEAIVAAICIALLFFFVKEKLFGIPDFSGKWFLKSITKQSKYNPFISMELQHQLFLRLEGNNLRGASEKIYENSSYGMRKTHYKHVLTYVGHNRSNAKIEGSIQKRIFSSDILTLHATEYGERRSSTIYCRFELKKKYWIFGGYQDHIFKGEFYSMVADQKGEVWLSQTEFSKAIPQIIPK